MPALLLQVVPEPFAQAQLEQELCHFQPYWQRLVRSDFEGWTVFSLNGPMWLAIAEAQVPPARPLSFRELVDDTKRGNRYFQAFRPGREQLKGYFRLVKTEQGYSPDDASVSAPVPGDFDSLRAVAHAVAEEMAREAFAQTS